MSLCYVRNFSKRFVVVFTVIFLCVMQALPLHAVSAATIQQGEDNGKNGTTLQAAVTAAGGWEQETVWNVAKTVDRATYLLQPGESAVPNYTVGVTKSTSNRHYVTGIVTVTNNGEVATEGLEVAVFVYQKLGRGPFQYLENASQTIIATAQIPAGQSQEISYQILLPEVLTGTAYKVDTQVSITNHSGGKVSGPSPAVDFDLAEVPALTGFRNITVRDVTYTQFADGHSGSSLPIEWNFDQSGSQSYSCTYRAEDAGKYTNTATILETGQSATAEVIVTYAGQTTDPGDNQNQPGDDGSNNGGGTDNDSTDNGDDSNSDGNNNDNNSNNDGNDNENDNSSNNDDNDSNNENTTNNTTNNNNNSDESGDHQNSDSTGNNGTDNNSNSDSGVVSDNEGSLQIPPVASGVPDQALELAITPNRVPAGDPTITVRTGENLKSVYAILPDGRKLNLQYSTKNKDWKAAFLVPFGTPDGPYSVQVYTVNQQGITRHYAYTITIDNSIPLIEVYPTIEQGEELKMEARILFPATTVTVEIAGKSFKLVNRPGSDRWYGSWQLPLQRITVAHQMSVIAEDGAGHTATITQQLVLPGKPMDRTGSQQLEAEIPAVSITSSTVEEPERNYGLMLTVPCLAGAVVGLLYKKRR